MFIFLFQTTKDVTLMSCVPTVLRILETIVYKVKAVLVANKCPTAFIMGNLINRNVKGEIIATQVQLINIEYCIFIT